MSLAAPFFAWLVTLAAVPIAIHLWGKPKAQVQRFAAMEFLVASDRQVAPRRRVRELLLMLLRALAIALVALTVAKPFFATTRPLLLGTSGAPESAVVVIDDSLSMNYRIGTSTLFERAQRRALELLESLPEPSEVALAFTSDAARDLPLTTDRARLLQTIRAARASHRVGDTGAAIARAAALLSDAPHAERHIYLLSDLAQHGFAGSKIPSLEAAHAQLVPIDLAGGLHTNRAVTDLRIATVPELGEGAAQISATLQNFSDTSVSDLEVTLRIDGKAVAKGLATLTPHTPIEKRFVHRFDPSASHTVEVELPADALPVDDRRLARIAYRRPIEVLLVSGDPRTIRREDELFFLETALDPEFHVTVENGLERLKDSVQGRDVIFLVNLPAPDAAAGNLLQQFVSGGGGLFLAVGDRTDCDAWNAVLGDLLPQPLATLRTVGMVASARRDGETRISGNGERIDRFDFRHPLLSPFAGAAGEALRQTRVGRFALLRPTPHAHSGTLLRLESGAPLLVEGQQGKGRVLLLTTTVDRDWSDLAIQPGYLPLMQQAVRYLTRTTLAPPTSAVLVGQPQLLLIEESDRVVEVTAPTGTVHPLASPHRFARTDEPGLYRVAAARTGALQDRPKAWFVVNPDPVESDLSPLTASALRSQPHATGGTPLVRQVELAPGLGALLLLVLLAEAMLSNRVGQRLVRKVGQSSR